MRLSKPRLKQARAEQASFSCQVGDPALPGFSLINRERRQSAGKTQSKDTIKASPREHRWERVKLVESQSGHKHRENHCHAKQGLHVRDTEDKRRCSVRLSPKTDITGWVPGKTIGRWKGI